MDDCANPTRLKRQRLGRPVVMLKSENHTTQKLKSPPRRRQQPKLRNMAVGRTAVLVLPHGIYEQKAALWTMIIFG
jgi:hypothetical protein